MSGSCSPRPKHLTQIPLQRALAFGPGQAVITMSVGQWDQTLAAAYESGWILLELNDRERPVVAYQKLNTKV